jgi:hypothetical protein
MEPNSSLTIQNNTGGHGRYEGFKRGGDLTGLKAKELQKNATAQRAAKAAADEYLAALAEELQSAENPEGFIDYTGENFHANPTY